MRVIPDISSRLLLGQQQFMAYQSHRALMKCCVSLPGRDGL